MLELGQVHTADERLLAAYRVAPGAISHVSWVVPDLERESARLARLGCRLIRTWSRPWYPRACSYASGEVVCSWRYASMDEAVRALLCSAGGARAAEEAGPDAVRDALLPALGRFQDPADGTVTMVNTFRWLAARALPFGRRR